MLIWLSMRLLTLTIINYKLINSICVLSIITLSICLGSLVAAAFVETDWALSFIIPGLIIGVTGFIIFLFLVVNPSDVGCTPSDTPEGHNGVFFAECI